MLYVLLALNGQRRRIVDFKIDQALDLIAFGVSWNCLLPVLIDAADEVIRNTDVKSSVATARQDVDVELVLIAILKGKWSFAVSGSVPYSSRSPGQAR